jgi:UDP-N-acetylmuramoyl-tripeptide--D-alanyl-D-alanine ligase
VPLTIIGAQSGWSSVLSWLSIIGKGLELIFLKRNYPDWIILEMGVGKPGDMKDILSFAQPDIAVLTALGEMPVHVEKFKSPDDLIKEKSLLVTKLKEGKTAILNGDDPIVFDLQEKIKAKTITYGFSAGLDMVASNFKLTFKTEKEDLSPGNPEGLTFKVDYKGKMVPVRLPDSFGRQNVYSALAALSVGSVLGLNLVEMAESLAKLQPPAGRVRLIEGIKDSYIIDDTYNSSPIALVAAIETLKELPAKRKIVVLGDMLELGKYTIEEHKKAGRLVAEVADLFFAVGPRMKFAAEEARASGMSVKKVLEYSTSNEAKLDLKEKIKEGDLLLVKGSQGMRMERVVEETMAHPELKEALLVRQEKEWLNR